MFLFFVLAHEYSVTLQVLVDFFKFKVRVLKWDNGKPVMLTTTSSPQRILKTPFIDFQYDQIDSPFYTPERVIFLLLRNGHYQCLVPNSASLNSTIAKYNDNHNIYNCSSSLNKSKKGSCNKPVHDNDNNNEEVEGDCCPICLDNIYTWNGVKLDCCRHMYHIFCIIEESKRSTKCPQCRREFKKITRLARDNANRLWHMNCVATSRENQPHSDDINDFLNDGVISYDEELSIDQIKCKVCNRGDREDVLIECDSHTCNNWAHIDCVSLHAVPNASLNEFWYCGECGLISNISNTIENGIKKRSEEEQHRNYISLLEEMKDGDSGASGSNSNNNINNRSGSRANNRGSIRNRRRTRGGMLSNNDTTSLRNTIIRGENDEDAINCIKDNFLKAATRVAQEKSIVDIRSMSSSSSGFRRSGTSSTSVTNTTGNNNVSEAFLWEQMRLAEEAANNSKHNNNNKNKKSKKRARHSEKKGKEQRGTSSAKSTSSARTRNIKNMPNNNNLTSSRLNAIPALSSLSTPSPLNAPTNVVIQRKRPRLRNRFQANKKQEESKKDSKAIIGEITRISRLAVVGLSQTERFFRRQYDVDLGKVTLKLIQSIQDRILLRNLVDNGILSALGQLLAPKIDASGKTIVPHFHFRRRILHFLSSLSVNKRDLRQIGHLVRALVFYSTYGNRGNEQNKALNDLAEGIVKKWRSIARGN